MTIKYNFEAARRKLRAATSFDPLSFRVKKERKKGRIYPIEYKLLSNFSRDLTNFFFFLFLDGFMLETESESRRENYI